MTPTPSGLPICRRRRRRRPALTCISVSYRSRPASKSSRTISAAISPGRMLRASASSSRDGFSTAPATSPRTSWSRHGRPMRPAATIIPPTRQDKSLDPGLSRLGPDRHRLRDRALYHPHHQAGQRGGPQGPQGDGAAHQFLAGLSRHQYRPRHAHVFRRRGSGQCPGSGAQHHRAARAAQDADRAAIRARRSDRLHIRHPSQGDRETVFFDV